MSGLYYDRGKVLSQSPDGSAAALVVCEGKRRCGTRYLNFLSRSCRLSFTRLKDFWLSGGTLSQGTLRGNHFWHLFDFRSDRFKGVEEPLVRGVF
jgi:hypothetical protein